MKAKLVCFLLGVLTTLASIPFVSRGCMWSKKLRLTSADMVGTWQGQESWGTTFTIVRKADGTFSEEIDSSRADVPETPAVGHAKGRWSLNSTRYGDTYVVVYDEVSNRPSEVFKPWSVIIKPLSPTSFRYLADEGNGVIEEKQ